MYKFKAKALMSVEELNKSGFKHEDGWVEGNLLDGEYICGEVLEADDEYIVLEFWVSIDKNTIELIKENK